MKFRTAGVFSRRRESKVERLSEEKSCGGIIVCRDHLYVASQTLLTLKPFKLLEAAGKVNQTTPTQRGQAACSKWKRLLFCKRDLVSIEQQRRRPWNPAEKQEKAPGRVLEACFVSEFLVLAVAVIPVWLPADVCRSGPHQSSAHLHPLNYRSRNRRCRILSTKL